MHREDENITSSGFSSLAYGPSIQSQISTMTIHDQSKPDESAVISIPSNPDTCYIVELNDKRMDVLDGWTRQNKTKEIKIPNFLPLVTGSAPDANLNIDVMQLPTPQGPQQSGIDIAMGGATADIPVDTSSQLIPSATPADIQPGSGAIPKTPVTARNELDELKRYCKFFSWQMIFSFTAIYPFISGFNKS